MENLCKKCRNVNAGIFLIRLGLAIIFIVHGISKFANIDTTISFFSSLGLGVFLTYLVTIIELLAGIAMLIGVWVEISAIALSIILLFAIFLVKINIGFIGGYEYDIMLLLSSIAIAFTGAGKYTVIQYKNIQHKKQNNANDSEV